MDRRANSLASTKDLFGCWWEVREARPTAHGFDLLLGRPLDDEGNTGRGGARVIPTRALYRYWHRRRMLRDSSIYDLPVSRTAIKAARKHLRLNVYEDHRRWWLKRTDDLRHLTLEQFARRHGRHSSQISVARATLTASAPVSPGGRRTRLITARQPGDDTPRAKD